MGFGIRIAMIEIGPLPNERYARASHVNNVACTSATELDEILEGLPSATLAYTDAFSIWLRDATQPPHMGKCSCDKDIFLLLCEKNSEGYRLDTNLVQGDSFSSNTDVLDSAFRKLSDAFNDIYKAVLSNTASKDQLCDAKRFALRVSHIAGSLYRQPHLRLT